MVLGMAGSPVALCRAHGSFTSRSRDAFIAELSWRVSLRVSSKAIAWHLPRMCTAEGMQGGFRHCLDTSMGPRHATHLLCSAAAFASPVCVADHEAS